MSLLRLLSAALVTVPFVASQSVCATLDKAHPDALAAQVSAGRAAAMLDKKPRNAQAAAHPDKSKESGKAPQGKGRAARTNSDRVRSLWTRQALRPKTRVAATRRGAAATAISSRRAAAQITGSANRAGVAPTVAGGATRASGGTGPGAPNPSLGRTSLSPGPASATPNRTSARSAGALAQSSAVRKGTLGGPHAQGYARLGGPVAGKAAQAAALDGTQLPRRRY
jgi:hypothetical protein